MANSSSSIPQPTRAQYQHRSWTQDQFTISTDSSLVPLDKLDDAFQSSDFHWAMAMPRDVLIETLQNSLCFGLYQPGVDGPTTDMIGFARCVTDFTTFVYLTDVYIWPEHQKKGLGKWLISCVQSTIEDMPYLRRSMLFTSDWDRSVPFYKKLMDMTVIQSGSAGQGAAILQHRGPGMPPSL